MSNNQTLEAIIDKVFSCTTVVQAHTTKETSKPTQYTITLKSPKEMGAKLGLEPASITITIKAEADVAKEIFPQDHAFRVTFQKTNLHYNPASADNNTSQRDRQSTLQLSDQTETEAEQTEPTDPAEQADPTETAEIEPGTGTAFWSCEEEFPSSLDDETCEAPNQ